MKPRATTANDLFVGLTIMARFACRLGQAYVDAHDGKEAVRLLERLCREEINAGSTGIADEAARHILFTTADKLIDFARAEPAKRARIGAP